MLKLPRRRPSYYNNYNKGYYSSYKSRRKISWVWLALSLPIAVILLELLARIFLGVMGNQINFDNVSPLLNAYNLKFLTANNQIITGLNSTGNLAVKRSTATGYKLVTQQKNQFLQINSQGFRDDDSVTLAKPKNEIRIFILGGSTAFGQGNKSNQETISYYLENQLQQRVKQQQNSPEKYRPDVFPFFKPDREKLILLSGKIQEKNYRVINAAVPGYTSGNELTQLALEILPYQPDLIIVLDGYPDLMLSSQESQTEIPKLDDFLENPWGHLQTALGKSFHQGIQEIVLVKIFNHFILKPQISSAEKSLVVNTDGKSLSQHLPQNEVELKRRVARYQTNHQRLLQLATKSGIPVIMALQPEITGRSLDKLSLPEKTLREQVGKDYLEQLPQAYSQVSLTIEKLAAAFPNQVKAINFYQENQKFPTPMFTDAIHLTDQANSILAAKLYNTITGWEKFQIIPENFYLKDVKQ